MSKKRHKSIYFLSFVLVLITGVVFFQISSAYTKSVHKEQELAVLEEELTREIDLNVQLESEKLQIDTEEYIKKKAREEFNLINDGEIIFIQEND